MAEPSSHTGISISVDDAQVVAMLRGAPEILRRRTSELVEGAAIDVQREMRIQEPVGVKGQLRGSTRYTFIPELLSAEIKPTVDYGPDVENGSKPRYVSVKEGTPLRAWAEFKGLNPYAVQAGIKKKGTRPNPFMARTYNRMKPIVERNIVDGIADAVRELDTNGV